MSTIDSYLVRLARAFEFCMAKPRQGTRTNANDRLPRPSLGSMNSCAPKASPASLSPA